jgi:hypothetical protein
MVVAYVRTELGQLVYDLIFTKLEPRYLARKHGLPIAKIRSLRIAALKGYREGRKLERKGARQKTGA